MSAPTLTIEEQLLREIRETPAEHQAQLLQVVREFRENVAEPSARESFRQGLYEALTGQTLPVSELWNGIDVE